MNAIINFSDTKCQLDIRAACVKGNGRLTDAEFMNFIEIAKYTGLNPFLKEIWAVTYGNSAAQIFIGRDGYRSCAQRHPDYDYHQYDVVYSKDSFEIVDGQIKHSYNFQSRENDKIVAAYCIVKKKSSSKPIYVVVSMKEYNLKRGLWNEKPGTMLCKVAEAQALRSTFPSLFAGTYHPDELEEEKSEPKIVKEAPKSEYNPFFETIVESIDEALSPADYVKHLFTKIALSEELQLKTLANYGVQTVEQLSNEQMQKLIGQLQKKLAFMR